ncbi:recombinase RecT [Jeotgalibacillus proteolyticus]|uniref:Recombinase n=1 Tax=Jeotgalibacillus proteolyticus TaxID=2082395 RepID=A0A2S5GAX2_9BACL|nr:recombinase RecT [Jeotgalibacillus proteolyticus]PPA70071.1 recombinase [Jeotgalibacillus proteolyticus]
MSNQNQLAMVKKDTVDVVANKVKEFQEKGELHFPAGYSPENAMKSAWLMLQEIKTSKESGYKPALEYCTKDSIANSLLDMVVQGLNPAKKQGYFIVYGKSLSFQRSYFGTMAVTKRVTGARSIDAAVIYEGDDVEYEIHNSRVTDLTHKQKFGNQNKEILGAYCTIVQEDGSTYIEVMTKEEIEKSWGQSKMNPQGEKSTHNKFPQEMAKRTVINRACKKFLNSSDDSSLLMEHFKGTDERLEEAQLEEELSDNANKEMLDLEYEEIPDEEQAPEPQKEPEREPVSSGGPGW